MGKIRIEGKTVTLVGAASGTLVITFSSTDKIQNYDFSESSSTSIKNMTSLYLSTTNEAEEYKYTYVLLWNYLENKTNESKYYHWVIDVYFAEGSARVDGYLQQTSRSSAPSIKNITVIDRGYQLLKKDMFNRWIIPQKYTSGSKFKIQFQPSYPATTGSQNIVATSALEIGQSFITNIQPLTYDSVEFSVTADFSNTKTQAVKIEFEDTMYVGKCTQYVLFTRHEEKTPTLSITPKSMTISSLAGQATFSMVYTNIEYSDLNVSYDVDWLTANIPQTQTFSLLVHVNENTGSQPRSTKIKVSGTNADGFYVEDSIEIFQPAKAVPYIGHESFICDYQGIGIIPAIKLAYSGFVYQETNELRIYEASVIKSVNVLLDGKATDYITVKEKEATNDYLEIVAGDKYLPNTTKEDIISLLTFNIETNAGEHYTLNVGLFREKRPFEEEIGPIWKDIYYITDKEYFRFRRIDTNEIIYNGKIYKEANNQIHINKILESYIEFNKLPFDVNEDETVMLSNNNIVQAQLEVSDSNTFASFDTVRLYTLYWNYSYNYNADDADLMAGYTQGYQGTYKGSLIEAKFANPIDYYDERQYIFINTAYDINTYNQNVEYVDAYNETGSSTRLITIQKDTKPGGSYTISVKPGFNTYVEYHIGQDYVWRCGKYKCTRANYAVYYLNSSGLWCWMLFEGKQLESLKVNVNKYFNNKDNSVSYNIHNTVYNNEIEEYYTLTSLYMKDDQSKKLKDLYISPLIYVHDLEEDQIYNVYLNTTTYDIKTYRNQGRKFYTHTIKLTKSLNKNISI